MFFNVAVLQWISSQSNKSNKWNQIKPWIKPVWSNNQSRSKESKGFKRSICLSICQYNQLPSITVSTDQPNLQSSNQKMSESWVNQSISQPWTKLKQINKNKINTSVNRRSIQSSQIRIVIATTQPTNQPPRTDRPINSPTTSGNSPNSPWPPFLNQPNESN